MCIMSKKRVSLTLDEDLVSKVNDEASGNDLNRSQQVEFILENYFSSRSITDAVVFCGGEDARSMEMHEGKPVLAHILDSLKSTTVQKVFLLAGRNADQISNYFGETYSRLRIRTISEERPEGTAAALEELEGKVSDTFLVLNGHVLSDVDIGDMLDVHREEGSMATMALTTVNDPSNYGVARLKGRTILGFEEKPSAGEEPSRLINAGTYIFEPEIFDELNSDSIEEVFEKLASERKLSGYIYGGEWQEFSSN